MVLMTPPVYSPDITTMSYKDYKGKVLYGSHGDNVITLMSYEDCILKVSYCHMTTIFGTRNGDYVT